jgi:hypothetical protein
MGKGVVEATKTEITVGSLPLRRREGARMGFGKREEGIVLHRGLVVGLLPFSQRRTRSRKKHDVSLSSRRDLSARVPSRPSNPLLSTPIVKFIIPYGVHAREGSVPKERY